MHVLEANGCARDAEAVRSRIIEAHRWLVVACARRMQRYQEPLDDLIQVGCVALIRSVDGFDRSVGAAFRAYATSMIMGELRHHYRGVWRVHTPRRIQEAHVLVARARDDLSASLRRTPTADDVADHLGISIEDVLEALDAGANQLPMSLDHHSVESSPHVATTSDGADGVDAAESGVTARAMLAALPELEREAMFLRYFQDLTQEEIGRRLGLSQAAVSRVVQSAFAHLRGERTRPVRRRARRITTQG